VSFPSFEAAKAGYGSLWRSMTIRQSRRVALEKAARSILGGKSRYVAVERLTGVPWFVVGLEHYREADCSFACHLHNGDDGRPDTQGRLTVRTRQVPAGRPPSPPPWTWEESARDALAVDGLDKITDWGIERIGYACEQFNGQGYFGHNVNSPYVWAGSNHYGDPPNTGKYVADHVFDPSAIDTQLGCMPLLAVMMEQDASIAARLGSPRRPPAAEPPSAKGPIAPARPGTPKPPVARPAPAMPGRHVGGAGIAVAVAALAHWLGAHPLVVVTLFVAVLAAFAFIMSKRT
jgi:lysozyme family protein